MSKELNKAPAEQAGGDERAAFEAWLNEVTYEENTDRGVFMVQRHQTLSVEDERIAWRAWQGRALLARSEQEEAERPVVVAHVVHSNPVVLDQCAQLNANDEMMTVAQHTASVARWAEMFNRVEQERDAALAEVERLRESKGDPSGSFDRCMKMMYERDENAKRLDAALARVAELTATRNRYGVDAHYFNKNLQRILRDFESFTPDELARSLIILAKVADEKVVAQAQQLHDMDKQCRDDVARALGLRPSQERGFAWSYLLASIKSCVKAAEDTDQAQHSVPDDVETFLDEVRAELLRARSKFPGDRIMTIALAEEFGELCKAVLDEPAANVRKEAVQTAVMAARVVLDGDGSVTAWRAERGLDPLAAAPGKEVGHE